MAVPGDPPDVPEGFGSDDEYRSVVFDEDFVRAARLQEYSAHERLEEHSRAVRSRSAWTRDGSGGGRAGRQGLLLLVIVALAFGFAVYTGLARPGHVPVRRGHTEALTAAVLPLAPLGPVPGGRPAELYARGPAAGYRAGAAGITLPAVRHTAHFSDEQVLTALSTAKEYLVRSGLDPDVLAGATVRPVRALLDPGQTEAFDESTLRPVADGRHAATGWLVRFEPGTAVVADPRIRVWGTLAFAEAGPDLLEVTTDHTFAYVLRPAAGPQPVARDRGSLFSVRRELRFRFDREDLASRRTELTSARIAAGPLDCADDPSGAFRPLLAGQTARTFRPPATDPYRAGHARTPAWSCGTLAAEAQPTPAAP
ncbi:hypothetical protein [Streptomyces sp. NPDC097619]|uniref:SCO2583 family membrane protein n=1 Tax=Streptomyces sp. NPDC097619 TaxID=3157228 RepID=UPI00331931D9